jgi:ribose 5-phosphate isomerase B
MNPQGSEGTILLASDHAGFELKERIKAHLSGLGLAPLDIGPESAESVSWADYGARAAARVAADPEHTRGVLVCGSGIGMAIVANKFPGVRAAQCYDAYTTEMSRRHNDANVMTLGARTIDAELALRLVDLFLSTPFEGGRHQGRLDYLRLRVEQVNFKPFAGSDRKVTP